MTKLDPQELLVKGIQDRNRVLEQVQESGVSLLWELGDIRARVKPGAPLAVAIDKFRDTMDVVECTLDPTLNAKGRV